MCPSVVVRSLESKLDLVFSKLEELHKLLICSAQFFYFLMCLELKSVFQINIGFTWCEGFFFSGQQDMKNVLTQLHKALYSCVWYGHKPT